MPKATLVCRECGATARRELSFEPGSRGHHETSTEPALCPRGHGAMARKDGLRQERWALWHPDAAANFGLSLPARWVRRVRDRVREALLSPRR